MKNFQDLKNRLTFLLKQPLPGKVAHSKFSPNGRPLDFSLITDKDSYRQSAVAIILFPKDDTINFLLIKRPTYDGVHSGQIAFPGGKQELFDLNSEHTARRETSEEIGIILEKNQLLGVLSEVFIPVSKFIIQPYIYWLDNLPPTILDKREVEYVLSQDIQEIIANDSIKFNSIHVSNNNLLENVPNFLLSNEMVWGATALILGELREIIINDTFLF